MKGRIAHWSLIFVGLTSLLSLLFPCLAAESPAATGQGLAEISIPRSVRLEGSRRPLKLNARYTSFVQPVAPSGPLTLKAAVDFAENNYPLIVKSKSQIMASAESVRVQKINEYMPDSLFQYQEFMASHNQLTSVFYGSPAFPGISGPGFKGVSMTPTFSANAGMSLDWAPVDLGLHKARIDASRLELLQARHAFDATRIDVATAVATAFLDACIAGEQIQAAQENVSSFDKFNSVVDAQIAGSLKPAADGYLSRAQLANAQNDLVRANLAFEIARARLATAMGVGGANLSVDSRGLAIVDEPGDLQKASPLFTDLPVVRVAEKSLMTSIQNKKILDNEYYPVLHLVGGSNVRGANLSPFSGAAGGQAANGLVPVRPNYWVALIVNWNFLDYFRLKAERKVQAQRIYQQQQDYILVLQNMRGRNAEAEATVRAAVALAKNMPVQVESAGIAMKLAETRYSTGLGSIAQVAQAAQLLANARVKQASARIGVWRALLEVAYVHGDLAPFVAEADRVQRGAR